MSATPPPRAAITYLTAVAIAMIGFGLAMVLSPAISDVFFNWMIFGSTGAPDGFTGTAVDYVRFSHGILGAVIAGWFALVLWLVRGPLAAGFDGAWSALVLSVLVWFAPDSTHSVVEGYWQNAVLNSALLAAFLPGLWLARPGRRATGPSSAPASSAS